MADLQKTDEDDTELASVTTNFSSSSCRHLLSTIALFLLNLAYVYLGAEIFSRVEAFNEHQECLSRANAYHKLENTSVTLLSDVLGLVPRGYLQQKGGYGVINENFRTVLRKFSLHVLNITYIYSYDCETMGESDGVPLRWSKMGSAWFALTVTTTIGYGFHAPKTIWGRMICIPYALFGIPLLLFCLASCGQLLANIFRYIYASVCCCGCITRKQEKVDDKKLNDFHSDMPDFDVDTNSSVSDHDNEEESDEDISVPITITVIAIFMFLFLGAGIFVVYESWSVLDGIYFSFITLATIGFGDLVPGTGGKGSISPTASSGKLLVTGLFAVLGMAWMSMCFQLIQNDIMSKLNWLKVKLGLIKSDASAAENEEDPVTFVPNGTEKVDLR